MFELSGGIGKHKKLKNHILCVKDMNPAWGAKKIRTFLKSQQVKPNMSDSTLLTIIKRTLRKGHVEDKPRSGRPRSVRTPTFIKKVKRKFNKKKTPGLAKVAKKENCCVETLRKTLREDLNLKPLHRQKSSAVKERHFKDRLHAAQHLLREFGCDPHAENSKWQILINSDFSGKISIKPVYNSKNAIVWAASTSDIPDSVRFVGIEKFNSGVILFGAVSWRGLIPKMKPFYLDEYFAKLDWPKGKKKSLTAVLYQKLLKEYMIPEIKKVYGNNFIWQDDDDRKHRAKSTIAFHEKNMPDFLGAGEQAAKMDDIWCVENGWGDIQEVVRDKEFDSIKSLKRFINKYWKNYPIEKCRRLICKIPKRLQIVVQKGGQRLSRKEQAC